MTTKTLRTAVLSLAAVAAASFSCGLAAAETLTGAALVDALRHGGYVIVMRHAESPRARPDSEHAAAGNTQLERQLDAQGRSAAAAMGRALKRLSIPVGDVLVSPAFRARETAHLLGFENPRAVPKLAEGKQGMKGDAGTQRSKWLRDRAAQPPRAGTDTLMITHLPNMAGAFGAAGRETHDGGALILRPENGRAVIVGHVAMDQWPHLAQEAALH